MFKMQPIGVPYFTGEELHDFRITAELPAKEPAGSLCAEVKSALKTKEIKSFACRPGTMGSIVKIQLTGSTKRTLTLCEVEVYGGNVDVGFLASCNVSAYICFACGDCH